MQTNDALRHVQAFAFVLTAVTDMACLVPASAIRTFQMHDIPASPMGRGQRLMGASTVGGEGGWGKFNALAQHNKGS